MDKVRKKILDLTEEEWQDFYYNPEEELEEIREESRKKGLEEGRIEGKKEGQKETTIKIAKSILSKNMSDEDIMEITNLTLDELNELK